MKILTLALTMISFNLQANNIESQIQSFLDLNCSKSIQSGFSYLIKHIHLIENDGHQAEYKVLLDVFDDYDHSPSREIEIEIEKELMFGKIKSLSSLEFCK